MNPTYTQLQHRLDIFRARLFGCSDPHLCALYQQEIYQMEAELAVMELMEEVDEQTNPREWEVLTDSLETVCSLFRDTQVKILELDKRWSWRALNWMHYVKWVTVK